MKYLFYRLITALVTPPRGGPTPKIDPYKRHAHSWREPKATRKKRKYFCVRVESKEVEAEKLGGAHSLVHCCSSVGRVWQE